MFAWSCEGKDDTWQRCIVISGLFALSDAGGSEETGKDRKRLRFLHGWFVRRLSCVTAVRVKNM